MEKISKFCGILGMALIIGFNFTLYIPVGIAGLIILNVQAIEKKLWNLVAVNIAGTIGLLIQLF